MLASRMPTPMSFGARVGRRGHPLDNRTLVVLRLKDNRIVVDLFRPELPRDSEILFEHAACRFVDLDACAEALLNLSVSTADDEHGLALGQLIYQVDPLHQPDRMVIRHDDDREAQRRMLQLRCKVRTELQRLSDRGQSCGVMLGEEDSR